MAIAVETMSRVITREEIISQKPVVIAGPCAMESREQMLDIATTLHDLDPNIILRAQSHKPRTSRDSFQGLGLDQGLSILEEIKERTGMVIATEIVDKDFIKPTEGLVDILWVGSRNMQNFELLKAMEDDPRPVILKRGFANTIKEWVESARYIDEDLNRVILCERGLRSSVDSMRFTLDLNGALVAKHDFGMPVLVDPSHTTGRADMVEKLALSGIAAGLDGIIVEVHPNPSKALSDKEQQITPREFSNLLEKVNSIYQIVQEK